MKGSSKTIQPATLQIRCADRTAKVRAYIPIRILAAPGPTRGKVSLNASEEFQLQDHKIAAATGATNRSVGLLPTLADM